MVATNAVERGFTLRRILNAPRDMVFQAWTDPAHLQWYFNPSMPLPPEPIEVDLRVGGAWRVKMVMNERLQYFTGGIYREIVPGEKLVFTWGAVDGWPEVDSDHPDDCPVVTLTLNELGEKTEMIFQVALSEQMSDERVREWLATGMRDGWSDTIDRLVTNFADATGNGGPSPKESNPISTPKERPMTYPQIVSRDEWLAARAELLIKEKEATRARDKLNAERRRLPMVKMDKEYLFEGPDGKARLLDLFDGRRQLIIYHFMFDPTWDDGCPSCTNLVDNIPFRLARIRARDTSLILVSRASLAKLDSYKSRMNWTIPWFSSYGSDFNYDFGVTDEGGEKPGLSVFLRTGEQVLHSYSTTGRGVDILLGTYNYLDLTPLGRQEKWEERPEGSYTPTER